MSSNVTRVALVTGANKGIGYHVVSHLASSDPSMRVLLGSRDLSRGREAVSSIGRGNVEVLHIDIDDKTSIQKAAEEVKKKYGGLDILCNNAGMAFKGDAFDTNVIDRTFKTNYYGTMDMLDTFWPIIKDNGRIVNVSSMSSTKSLKSMSKEWRAKFLKEDIDVQQLNSLFHSFRDSVSKGSWVADGWPSNSYGMSKVGVTILTRIYARRAEKDGRGVTVNCVCPGWCATDMAGSKAPRPAAVGGEMVAHVCLLPTSEKTNGEFWEDKAISTQWKEIDQ